MSPRAQKRCTGARRLCTHDRYVFRLFELPHGMEPAARPNIRPSAARLRAQATSSRLDRNSSPTAQLASAGAHHHRTSQPKQRYRSKANTRSLKRTGLELIGALSWPSFEGNRIRRPSRRIVGKVRNSLFDAFLSQLPRKPNYLYIRKSHFRLKKLLNYCRSDP